MSRSRWHGWSWCTGAGGHWSTLLRPIIFGWRCSSLISLLCNCLLLNHPSQCTQFKIFSTTLFTRSSRCFSLIIIAYSVWPWQSQVLLSWSHALICEFETLTNFQSFSCLIIQSLCSRLWKQRIYQKPDVEWQQSCQSLSVTISFITHRPQLLQFLLQIHNGW